MRSGVSRGAFSGGPNRPPAVLPARPARSGIRLRIDCFVVIGSRVRSHPRPPRSNPFFRRESGSWSMGMVRFAPGLDGVWAGEVVPRLPWSNRSEPLVEPGGGKRGIRRTRSPGPTNRTNHPFRGLLYWSSAVWTVDSQGRGVGFAVSLGVGQPEGSSLARTQEPA